MTDIKWGPAIAVDGKRPGWLCDGEWRRVRSLAVGEWQTADVESPGDTIPDMNEWNWGDITAIRLPADHPHYRQTEVAPIDWSGELEAVHKDGRVVRVTVAKGPDKDGDREVMPQLDEVGRLFGKDGTPWSNNGWRIRNVAQPTPQADTKPDLTARMEALVRKLATWTWVAHTNADKDYAEARAIVALLPEPVDPDVELVDEVMFGFGWEREDARFSDVHAVAFDCIKRGRALALAGEKEA